MWITLRKQKPIGSSMSFFISLCFHVLIQNLLSDHRPDSAAEDIFVSHTVGPSLASCKLQITPLQVNTHGHPKPCPIVSKTQKYWRTHKQLLMFRSLPRATMVVVQVTVLWPHLSKTFTKHLLLNMSPCLMILMAFICDPYYLRLIALVI